MVDTTNTWHSLELWPNLLSLIRIGSSWFTSSPRSFEYLPSEFGRPSGPWPNFKLGVLGMFTGAFGCLNISCWSGEDSRSDSNSTTKIPNAEIPRDCSWTARIVGNLPWIPCSFHQQVIMTACPLTFTTQAMLSPQKLPLLLPQMDTFWSPGPWSPLTIWAGSSSSPFSYLEDPSSIQILPNPARFEKVKVVEVPKLWVWRWLWRCAGQTWYCIYERLWP